VEQEEGFSLGSSSIPLSSSSSTAVAITLSNKLGEEAAGMPLSKPRTIALRGSSKGMRRGIRRRLQTRYRGKAARESAAAAAAAAAAGVIFSRPVSS
jgi:hypothetical protein